MDIYGFAAILLGALAWRLLAAILFDILEAKK